MKKIFLLSMLALSQTILAQKIEKKCKTCGKQISECKYNGKHPVPQRTVTMNNTVVLFSKFCPDENHPHVIDLGLSSGTKWACCNVGATKPESNGDYYAWGETSVKSSYEYKTYVHHDHLGCRNIGYDISGTKFDVAHIKWGGNWTMPSLKQFDELTNECTYRWGSYKGKMGMEITGPNGATLFFPATGIKWWNERYHLRTTGGFWTSTANRSVTSPCCFGFDENKMGTNLIAGVWDGQTIRPVIANSRQIIESQNSSININQENICPDNNHPHAIDLNLPSGTKWACCNIGANAPESGGLYYAWGETDSKDSYTWMNYLHCNGTKDSCKRIGNDISGSNNDAAKVVWGNMWCTPTQNQYEELFENCSYKWLNYKNKSGILIIGTNGMKVFLPANGYKWNDAVHFEGEYGYYETASIVSGLSSETYELVFDSRGYSAQIPNYRFCGVSIRAICNNNY